MDNWRRERDNHLAEIIAILGGVFFAILIILINPAPYIQLILAPVSPGVSLWLRWAVAGLLRKSRERDRYDALVALYQQLDYAKKNWNLFPREHITMLESLYTKAYEAYYIETINLIE
jgi:hypothetical protein